MTQTDKPISQLLAELGTDLRRLFKQEVKLARADLVGKLADVAPHLALLLVGGAAVLAGALALAAALVLLVAEVAGLPVWGAALLIGGLLLALGAWLLRSHLEELGRLAGTWTVTLHSIEGGN